ncbi:hypothetical protein CI238_06266 [Colletotrichum incanum]|uniref:Uncharacterized protein n=1 Tax=Colletotrichum incanum TaxID=1573173 RepID=A0A166NDU2_COLIC|nr:hypothetical protein CI238_06266 [Colletotrichum incanum]
MLTEHPSRQVTRGIKKSPISAHSSWCPSPLSPPPRSSPSHLHIVKAEEVCTTAQGLRRFVPVKVFVKVGLFPSPLLPYRATTQEAGGLFLPNHGLIKNSRYLQVPSVVMCNLQMA